MSDHTKRLKRIMRAQSQIKTIEQRRQGELMGEVARLKTEVSEVQTLLGQGGLSSSVFHDVSNRFLSRLMDKQLEKSDALVVANQRYNEEKRRLERLEERYKTSRYHDERKAEEDEMLEFVANNTKKQGY